MDYTNYTVEQFLEDPDFVKWVLQPDGDTILFWEKWLIKYPEKLEDIQSAREIILTFQENKFHWDRNRKQKLWNRIQDVNSQHEKSLNKNVRFLKDTDHIKSTKEETKSSHFFKASFKWAAVLLLLILTSIYIIKHNPEEPEVSETVALVNKSVSKGQKLKIFLPDGSTVYMNSESSISYEKNFSSQSREINLTGEAFFEVAKDSLRPFIVRSDNLVVTALGTSFNIRASADEQQLSVALLTGMISVQNNDSQDELLFLNPNEAAILDKKANALQRKDFNFEEDILWTQGILYFKQIPLTEAFDRLERWYGVSFIIENLPKKPLLVTGKFDNESLENVLRSLSHTTSFETKIDNGKVMVSF